MRATVYTVHAYRWGDRECHSYTVGVYSKKHAALKAAETEADYRGGKYECEVLEWTLDSGREGGHDAYRKTIKPLPLVNTLKAATQEGHSRGSFGRNNSESAAPQQQGERT